MAGGSSLFNDRIGTTFESKKWLALDPCGLICSSISYSLHIFALITINHNLISHQLFSQVVYYVVYIPTALLALSNLFMAQHSDPGAVPLGARPLPIIPSPVSSPSKAGRDGVVTDISSDNTVSLRNYSNAAIGNTGNEEEEDDFDDNDSKSLLASASRVASNAIGDDERRQLGFDRTPPKRRRGIRRCRKCGDNYKPPRAHHDSVTGRCIVKFDHFCPWVGNAVGALNHKFFFLFVLYTFLTSIISLLLLLVRFFRCGFMVEETDDHNNTNSTDYANTNTTKVLDDADNTRHRFLDTRWLDENDDVYHLHTTFKYEGCEELYSIKTLVLIVISVTFLFFTCCMLFEQMDAIQTNTYKIAKMKVATGQADSSEFARVCEDVNEFFGGDSGHVALHWFLPLPIWFPEGKRDQVMGFEYKPEWYGKIYHEGIDDEEHDEELGSSNSNSQITKKNSDDQGKSFNNSNGDNENQTSPLMLSENNDTNLELEMAQNYGEDKHSSVMKKRVNSKKSTGLDPKPSAEVV